MTISKNLDEIYRTESRRVFATLVKLLGDFDLAEDAMIDAFTAAASSWERDGLPTNPRAWLVSTGRNKAIDLIRRRAKLDQSLAELAREIDNSTRDFTTIDPDAIEDDRLRLMFLCCHPELPAESQMALTLREVCGLTTEEIARAFLVLPQTMAQRIVRAKSKLRAKIVTFEVPPKDELPERLGAVLHVVYLIFNEGYSSSSGDNVHRSDLTAEAIRLTRLLTSLLPETEVKGLLALLLLMESRRSARTSDSGDIILLEHQDRKAWDSGLIAQGIRLVECCLKEPDFGSYSIQAAIVAVHSEAKTFEDTDWQQIVALYTVLFRYNPSPVVELNRAVALAMTDGPEAGLVVIDRLMESGELSEYHLAYSAKADMLRRMGRQAEAIAAYKQALSLSRQTPEKRFIEKRLVELSRSN